MEAWFFISSAANVDTRAVRRLHTDLEEELQARSGGARVGGLLSTRSTAHGGEMQSSGTAEELPAMVALCSEAYFQDEWCGREWAVFRTRTDAAERAGQRHAAASLIRVPWRPHQPPDSARRPAEAGPEFGQRCEQIGLQALLRVAMMDEDGYYATVRAIAERVREAQDHRLPTLSPTEAAAVGPAFGTVKQSPAPSADRLVPPAHTVAAGPRTRPVTAAVSYVGADQEWADWTTEILRRRGHTVHQVRWAPAGGETLEATLGRARERGAEHLVVLLSRRYHPTLASQAGVAEPVNWDLLDDGAFPDLAVTRLLIDHEPLPEPLRSMPHDDVSEFTAEKIGAFALTLQPARPVSPSDIPQRRPGELCRIWNAPAENQFFIGRDAALESVRQLLTTTGRAVLVAAQEQPHMAVAEAAVEYVHRYKQQYDAVWWVLCEHPDRIPEQLRERASRIREAGAPVPADKSNPGAARAGAVLDPARSLLVFAGAADPDAVAAAVPAGSHHVLVVADRTVPTWEARTVELGSLTRWESVRQLRGAATMVEPATANGIAEALDDRPALLVEVARHLLRERVDPELCLRLLTMPPAVRPPTRDTGPRPAGTAVDERERAVGTAGEVDTAGDAGDAGEVSDPKPAGTTADSVAGTTAYPTAQLTDTSGGHPPNGWQPRPDPDAGPATDRRSGDRRDASPEPAGGARSPLSGHSRRQVSDRDVDTLLGELVAVDCVADPGRAGEWFTALTDILGRQPSLPDAEEPGADLRVRMTALLEEATSQPSPAMLEALAWSLEATDPADPAVGRFRQVVDQLGTRWGAPRGRGGIQPLPRPPRRLPAADTPPDTDSDPDAVADRPSYLFFTSYARRGDREDVARFHAALQEELSRKVRRTLNHMGFLDRLSMDGGAHWHAELRRALRTSPIMIALLSDDYFESDWCGREFAVFDERIRRATPPGGLPPRCLIPVPWLRRQDPVPPSAAHIQELTVTSSGRDGLPLVDLMRESPRQFRSFIIRLADRIVEQAPAPLPPLDEDATSRLSPAFGKQR